METQKIYSTKDLTEFFEKFKEGFFNTSANSLLPCFKFLLLKQEIIFWLISQYDMAYCPKVLRKYEKILGKKLKPYGGGKISFSLDGTEPTLTFCESSHRFGPPEKTHFLFFFERFKDQAKEHGLILRYDEIKYRFHWEEMRHAHEKYQKKRRTLFKIIIPCAFFALSLIVLLFYL